MCSDASAAAAVTLAAGAMVADRCVLLPGVTVGRRCVLGSGSVTRPGRTYASGATMLGSQGGDCVVLDAGSGLTGAVMACNAGVPVAPLPSTPDKGGADTEHAFGRTFYGSQRQRSAVSWPVPPTWSITAAAMAAYRRRSRPFRAGPGDYHPLCHCANPRARRRGVPVGGGESRRFFSRACLLLHGGHPHGDGPPWRARVGRSQAAADWAAGARQPRLGPQLVLHSLEGVSRPREPPCRPQQALWLGQRSKSAAATPPPSYKRRLWPKNRRGWSCGTARWVASSARGAACSHRARTCCLSSPTSSGWAIASASTMQVPSFATSIRAVHSRSAPSPWATARRCVPSPA